VAILRVEHGVPDFDAWKRERFDRDPLNRAESGVRRYRVFRGAPEPDFASVELEFDTFDEAEAFAGRLREMWQDVSELSNPTVRILEEVDSTEL
jgi:hypothetical protein